MELIKNSKTQHPVGTTVMAASQVKGVE